MNNPLTRAEPHTLHYLRAPPDSRYARAAIAAWSFLEYVGGVAARVVWL